ncbi:MAG: multidrug effflux MFS transporter [Psychromonas sp.]|nr:multidrug effflux MFS transporter [Psychromonas sp.]
MKKSLSNQVNILFVSMTMVVLNPLATDIYLPSLPVMASEFNVSLSSVESTLALYMLALGVGQILIGPLSDRFGRRPIALCGLIFYIASSLVAAYTHIFLLLEITRVTQGIATCATSIVVFSVVRDSCDNVKSAYYYSYINGALCVIPALAPTLGGWLASMFGWRSTFLFMALFAFIVLFIVMFKLPETRPKNTDVSGKIYHIERYKPVLKERVFLFYAFACMAGMAPILVYISYAPGWLIKHLGVSEMTFSWLFALNALVTIVGAFSTAILIKRFGKRMTVIIALSTMLASAVIEIAAQFWGPATGLAAAYAFMLPMMLLGVGFAFLLGPATSMALAPFGDRASTASGLLGFIQMSGAAVIAVLIEQTNLTAPYAVGFLMGALMIVFLVMMAFHQERNVT